MERFLCIARWRRKSGARVALLADGRLMRCGPRQSAWQLVTQPCSRELAEVYVRQLGGFRYCNTALFSEGGPIRLLVREPKGSQSISGCVERYGGLWIKANSRDADHEERDQRIQTYAQQLAAGQRIFEPGEYEPSGFEGVRFRRHGLKEESQTRMARG